MTVISTTVAELIAEVTVTDNQAVHAGDLLVRLDDRDYRAALARATGAVAAQEAVLAKSRCNPSPSASDDRPVRSRGSLSRRRDGALTLGRRALSPTRFDQYASIQRFQQADADNRKALAAAGKARAALAAAQRRLDVIDTQKQETRAALAQVIADRDMAQLNLGFTELRAPIDGMAGNRNARVGAYAMVGAQLISLVPARGLWVDANFKDR